MRQPAACFERKSKLLSLCKAVCSTQECFFFNFFTTQLKFELGRGTKETEHQNLQVHKFPTTRQNKPGTAQVGAISKAQKYQKDFKVSSILFYSTRVRENWKKIRIFLKFVFGLFFWPPVSRIVSENVKGRLWEFLNIHSFAK